MCDANVSVPLLHLSRAVIGLDFPATKDEVIAHVRRQGGQPQVLAVLRELEDRTFAAREDLVEAMKRAPH